MLYCEKCYTAKNIFAVIEKERKVLINKEKLVPKISLLFEKLKQNVFIMNLHTWIISCILSTHTNV